MKDKFTIVFSYYDFNYGLRLSRYIGSRHFSPEEQQPVYRPVALKGLKEDCRMFCPVSHNLPVTISPASDT
jgi:hypothetical protein